MVGIQARWAVSALFFANGLVVGSWAPKLPAMARNLGQSMRIFSSEVKQMRTEGKGTTDERSGAGSTAADEPVEGRVVERDETDPRDPR